MLRRRVWRPSVCLLPYARRTVTTITPASAFTCATTQTSLSCSVSANGAFHASSVRYAPRGPRPAPPRQEPTQQQQQQQRSAPAASESEKKAEEPQQQPQRTKEDTTVTHSTTSNSMEGVDELPESPFDCMIDSVLPPQAHIGPQQGLPTTLRALVQLLIDPNASNVEDVPLSVFVAMMPRRQLAALGENKAWHEVVLASERYQGYKDARALRLVGVTSVGKWELQPDRVPLSAYSRGVLEKTYHTIMRQARRGPQQQQQSEVMAWLSKTIHKAILDEFASSNKANTQLLLPLIGTLPRTEAMQAIAPISSETAPQVVPTTATTNKNEAVQPQSSTNNEEHVVHEDDDEDNTADDFERLMREDEERQRQDANTVEAATSSAASKSKGEQDKVTNKQEEATAKANEDNNEEEEEEEIVEEIVEEVEEEDDVVASKEADVTAAAATKDTTTAVTSQANASVAQKDNNEEDDSTLVHLAQLMLRQFNSADGYLHQTKKELRAEEKNGYVIALDEDTAQVDPLALFSTFHTATPPSTSPIEVKALKEIWSSYNAHQLALEAAMERHEESAVDFHKEKSVEALVHGAVLLRAISREDVTTLKASSELPAFGFPLLSSDTRPYAQRRPRSSPHTDMNAKRVQDALAAYRGFFADKESRMMPFRPAIECNAGCGVVMLSGTTLHLYETSMKESVQEEQVRIHFAEAMLGVLHILREKIIPRVNTVHYHILVTKLNTNTSNSNGVEDMHGLMSATTIVSVDLTGPFTNAEKHRLRALAEPLGLAREVAEFGCVEDIVMELEESTRASVVHDLLQTREDLEALLTPTLAQLLPEDDEVTGLTEEQEGEPTAQPVHEGEEEEDSAQQEGRARNNKSRRKEVKHNNDEEEEEVVVKKAADEDEVVEQEEDDWSEEVEEEETATRAASHRHKSQSAARNKEHHNDDEDDEVGATGEEEEEVTHTRRGGATLTASSSASRRAQPSTTTTTTTVTSSRARPTASATPSRHAFEYTAQGNKEEEDTTKSPAQDDEDVEEEEEVVEEGEEEEEVVEEDEEAAEEQEEERNGTASTRTQRESPANVRRHKGSTRHNTEADTHATASTRAANAYNEEHDNSIAEEEEEEVTSAAQSHHEEVEEDVVVRHVRGRKTATQSIPPRTARVPVPEDYYEDAEEEQSVIPTRPVVPARRTVTQQQQQVQQQQPTLRTGATTAAPPQRRAATRQAPSPPPAATAANDEYIEEEEVEEEEVHTPAPPPQPLRRSPVSPLRMASSPNTTPVAATTSQTSVTVRRPVPRERLPASPPVTQTTTSVVRPGRNTQHTSSISSHSEDVVEHEAVYEEAAAQTQSSSSATPQEQWFKRRPKKRYFS